MRTLLLAATFLTTLILLPQHSVAGPIVDEAARAESLAADGDDQAAIIAMDSAIAKLWDKLGLTIVEATFTDGPPKSYGRYTNHPNSVFKSGEDMIVYVETIGYRYAGGEGEFNISLTADMTVKSPDGKELATKKGFTKLVYNSRLPNREFMIVITYTFDGIPKGNYIVSTKLNDNNFDQWASFDLPFEVK